MITAAGSTLSGAGSALKNCVFMLVSLLNPSAEIVLLFISVQRQTDALICFAELLHENF
jgi:hypothetical protein